MFFHFSSKILLPKIQTAQCCAIFFLSTQSFPRNLQMRFLEAELSAITISQEWIIRLRWKLKLTVYLWHKRVCFWIISYTGKCQKIKKEKNSVQGFFCLKRLNDARVSFWWKSYSGNVKRLKKKLSRILKVKFNLWK